MITITIEDRQGKCQSIELPTDINLSLMEALKAADYPILATCGGIALCATCHVQVLQGGDRLPPPAAAELEMLDTLPDAGPESRLACQIRIEDHLNGLSLRLLGDDEE